jgi:glucose-6-phosphate isomerase
MIEVQFDNLTSDAIGSENGLSGKEFDEIFSMAPDALKKLGDWRASKDALFYDLVADDGILAGITEKADAVAERFENVVVLGIGGSALGLRAAAEALLPPHWNIRTNKERKDRPRLFVCDNVDPESFAGLLDLIDIKKTCFTIISKSGRTTEPAALFMLAMKRLKDETGDKWRGHLVVITDPEGGELRPMVKEEGLTSFEIPPKLGGRFSVLSPVGLFPAACVGIDIEGLVYGARNMAKRCSEATPQENPAYNIGASHYWYYSRKNKNISVMFAYSNALLLTADWYSQLWAESLGKKGLGQTPVRALGATDQHSQVQLYMDGPGDKIFTFIGVEKFRTAPEETRITGASEGFEYLNGHDLGEILRAEQKATTKALAEMGRPSLTVTFPEINAEHLGEFFMLYELATVYAGALYKIDPFNQPGVELGKKLTKEILTS